MSYGCSCMNNSEQRGGALFELQNEKEEEPVANKYDKYGYQI